MPTLTPTQVDGFSCLPIWVRYGYNKTNGRPIANDDLWKQIAYWTVKCYSVVVRHVRVGVESVLGNTEQDRRMLRALLQQL